MGAQIFTTYGTGANLQKAFEAVRDQALYDHGHGGYSGTIAEKSEVKTVSAKGLSLEEATALADQLVQDDDPRIDDKWGPAGAIRVKDKDFNGWLFFGWASS